MTDCNSEVFLGVISGFILFVFLAWILVVDVRLDQPCKRRKPQGHSEDRENQTPIALNPSVKTDVPPTYRNTNGSNDNKEYRLEKKKYRVEVLTLFGLVAYVVINWYILNAMQGQNVHSERALEVTERAYVNVQSVTLANAFKIGESAEALVSYQNTGLTPARELNITPLSDIIPNPFLQIPRPAPKRWLRCQTNSQGGVLPPKVARTVSNATQIGALRNSIPFTPKIYQAIVTNEIKLLSGAVIQYRDQFGHCHATSEPFWYNPATEQFDPAPYGFQQVDD